MPDWFTKPEAIFRTVLWFLGPFFAWAVGRLVIKRWETWYAARSLESARSSLKRYRRRIENPPTLLESVAEIVCLLPIPLAFLSIGLFFLNPPSWAVLHGDVNTLAAPQTFRNTSFFLAYVTSGILGLRGYRIVGRLRLGEAFYMKIYMLEMANKIAKLERKYPSLQEPAPDSLPDITQK